MSEVTYLERFSGRVDREKHVIRGVSLMTIGPCKGHGFDVDHLTLQQVKAKMPPLGLKAMINHRDLTGVMAVNGRMKDPRIEGDHLRADWHLNPGKSTTGDILALAEFQPEDAGISLRFMKQLERKDGKSLLRIDTLSSADLVDDPAANDSLLSAKTVDTPSADMSDTISKAEFDELKKNHTELSAKTDRMYDALTGVVSLLRDQAGEEDELSLKPRKRVTELSAPTDFAKALAEAMKPVTTELATIKTKLEATETTLAAIKQPPVPANQAGAGSGNPVTKTKEETELQTKLETYTTDLSKLKGLNRTFHRQAIEKELGKPWKELEMQLTELKAKN